jgi:hypothetical protein
VECFNLAAADSDDDDGDDPYAQLTKPWCKGIGGRPDDLTLASLSCHVEAAEELTSSPFSLVVSPSSWGCSFQGDESDWAKDSGGCKDNGCEEASWNATSKLNAARAREVVPETVLDAAVATETVAVVEAPIAKSQAPMPEDEMLASCNASPLAAGCAGGVLGDAAAETEKKLGVTSNYPNGQDFMLLTGGLDLSEFEVEGDSRSMDQSHAAQMRGSVANGFFSFNDTVVPQRSATVSNRSRSVPVPKSQKSIGAEELDAKLRWRLSVIEGSEIPDESSKTLLSRRFAGGPGSTSLCSAELAQKLKRRLKAMKEPEPFSPPAPAG